MKNPYHLETHFSSNESLIFTLLDVAVDNIKLKDRKHRMSETNFAFSPYVPAVPVSEWLPTEEDSSVETAPGPISSDDNNRHVHDVIDFIPNVNDINVIPTIEGVLVIERTGLSKICRFITCDQDFPCLINPKLKLIIIALSISIIIIVIIGGSFLLYGAVISFQSEDDILTPSLSPSLNSSDKHADM